MTEESTFARRLREKREAEAAKAAAEAVSPPSTEYTDLVPEADAAYERSDTDRTIDGLIEGLSIEKAYDYYIKKPRPAERSGKREGVMISCPRPNHPDRNPSAWMNLDKGTWYCPGCDIGGDVMDLAAIGHGMTDYKTGKHFGELRTAIAADLGYREVKAPGMAPTLVEVEDSVVTPPPAPAPPPPAAAPVPAPAPTAPPALSLVPAPAPPAPEEPGDGATVTELNPEDGPLFDIQMPALEWKPLVTPGTFLDKYMDIATRDDVPEEYHFWMALLAISMAVGRDVRLYDGIPVLANLFVCIIGRTGSGKSRATSHARKLVKEALPWDGSDPFSRGAKPLTTPGSAEHLINQFSAPIPTAPGSKIIMGHAPVRGLVEFNELSALIGRGGRSGSVLKPTLMQFFDGDPYITTGSKTNGTDIAENSFASCVTSVQPKALPVLVGQGDADSGFLNRWIFASGSPKKRVAIGGEVIDMTPCVQPLRDIQEWANDARVMQWSEEAAEEFTHFFETQMENLLANDDTGLLSRLDLLCKKLCLLLSANEMLEEVSVEVVFKVQQIFRYMLAVFGIQAENINNDEDRMCQNEVVQLIERRATKAGGRDKDKGASLNEIVKALKSRYSLKMIRDNLSIMSDLGILEVKVPEKAAGPGRPPVPRYKLASGE